MGEEQETEAESSTKGKNKEAENVVKSLDLVVKNNENIVSVSSKESKKNLEQIIGKEKDNKLY
jgi:hypothetical protein